MFFLSELEHQTELCVAMELESERLGEVASKSANKLLPANSQDGQEVDSTLELQVFLPSGRSEAISFPLSDKIGDLKIAAQRSLGQSFLRLTSDDGRLLNPAESLQVAGLKNGDSITAIAQRPSLCASSGAFALWCFGGEEIVAWGHPSFRGDIAAVQHQLRNIQQIVATEAAFAAVLADGSIVTWGDSGHGGNSTALQDQLRNVRQLCAARFAFAAILADKTVVTWGSRTFGGDSTAVRDQLRDVQQIHAMGTAFAAILADGSVVTWGIVTWCGYSIGVEDQLSNLQQTQATGTAFAAILSDGSVVTWGNPNTGGDSTSVQDQLRNVQQLSATESAFAAILGDGSVVTWGVRR